MALVLKFLNFLVLGNCGGVNFCSQTSITFEGLHMKNKESTIRKLSRRICAGAKKSFLRDIRAASHTTPHLPCDHADVPDVSRRLWKFCGKHLQACRRFVIWRVQVCVCLCSWTVRPVFTYSIVVLQSTTESGSSLNMAKNLLLKAVWVMQQKQADTCCHGYSLFTSSDSSYNRDVVNIVQSSDSCWVTLSHGVQKFS